MTVLRSTMLLQAGFRHGFGTRRTTPSDYPERVHILSQVHGERIVVLSRGGRVQGTGSGENGNLVFMNPPETPFRFMEGDAIVTDIPGVSIGIRTADCLPVLLADKASGATAAIHCGWRSLALGLAGKGVETLMNLKGSDPGDLAAAIGPSIDACCYEIGEEVRRSFVNSGKDAPGLFEERNGALYLNLSAAVSAQLIGAGMFPRTIEKVVGCTMCEPDLFWSHRGRGEKERMVSWITTRQV